ncbi:cytochrome c3 family protein [Romeria aff. gracilis LEGE 07310]|uniref:Cytochrome c3 family protein n=1 Tax=Vasconcelosia minhoensis LEGE 07310 TaxID=915328 RepID=A0A8J7DMF9_9CYAN|nr:cytochrome c3 family protein [Romeria gracilis]MBE9076580.1 cytochrome c3 family protein [Romeria aff. gracilis LEGE 07310]
MVANSNRRFDLRKGLSLRVAVILVMVILVTWFSAAFALEQKQIFMPGETSVGHYLFDTSCASCHEGFKPVTNETCNRCHEAELAEDAHGATKFRDPRWATYRDNIDVLTCTACHNEHVHMFGRGVHLQPDLCMVCHEELTVSQLKSHEGFAADGCWTAGCHNFHDHRTISTGFLRQNMGEPAMLPVQQLPDRNVTTTIETAPAPNLKQEFLGGST